MSDVYDRHPEVKAMIDDSGPTCTLEQFVAAEKDDPNLLWRIQGGHVNNLLEEALDRLGLYGA